MKFSKSKKPRVLVGQGSGLFLVSTRIQCANETPARPRSQSPPLEEQTFGLNHNGNVIEQELEVCSENLVPKCGRRGLVHRTSCLPGMKTDYSGSCVKNVFRTKPGRYGQQEQMPNIYHLSLE